VNSAKSAKKKWPICEQACLHEQLGKYAKLFANVISIIYPEVEVLEPANNMISNYE